jgi:hypothetical protein
MISAGRLSAVRCSIERAVRLIVQLLVCVCQRFLLPNGPRRRRRKRLSLLRQPEPLPL